jgi:hypothetical protein
MARRKRVEADLSAWAKAHEAEAKRAERSAKIGGDIGEAWQTYAGKCRREAFDVLTREALPLECDLAPVPVEVMASGNTWRDHLLALEAQDAARFMAAKQ